MSSSIQHPASGIRHLAKGIFPREALLKWYRANRRDLPWRATRDPYAILVSEIMLQQTQVKTVIPYYHRWMEAFPDAAMLARAPEEKVLKLWEGLGYYRRARNLQAAARLIRDRGAFPGTLEELLSLPGVGRYTAGAVGSIALGWRLPVVDGNVSRVLARILGVRRPVKTPEVQEKFWAWMERTIPGQNPGDFNQAMMELGATVCLPQNPDCAGCPLQLECVARRRSWQDRIPASETVPSVARIESAVLMRDRGGVWLVRRVPGEWHEGLWALPSVVHQQAAPGWIEDFNRRFRTKIGRTTAAHSARYQVTHHRIELRIFEAAAAHGASDRLKYRRLSEIGALPIVTAHRKSMTRLGLLDS